MTSLKILSADEHMILRMCDRCVVIYWLCLECCLRLCNDCCVCVLWSCFLSLSLNALTATHVTVIILECWLFSQARTQRECDGGNCPPNSECCTKNVQVNYIFDVQAKQIHQCKSTKLLKEPFLLQPLVQGSQSRGPRVTCGPLGHFVRTAMLFENSIKI